MEGWEDKFPKGLIVEHYAGSGGESDVQGVLLRQEKNTARLLNSSLALLFRRGFKASASLTGMIYR